MQRRNQLVLLFSFEVFLVAWIASNARAQDNSQQARSIPIAVIVHPKERESNISLSDLQMLFLKQKQSWGNHASMIVFNWETNDPLRVAFDQQVNQMNSDQVASYWLDRRTRGYGLPPRSLRSSSLLQRIVSNQKDAISYIRLDEIRENVKILKIDGKRPDEPGYPFRLELNP